MSLCPNHSWIIFIGTFFELKCQDISQKHVRFLSFFHFNHNLIIFLRNQVCYHQCFAVTTNALYVTISNLSNISNTRETEFTLASYYIQILNISYWQIKNNMIQWYKVKGLDLIICFRRSLSLRIGLIGHNSVEYIQRLLQIWNRNIFQKSGNVTWDSIFSVIRVIEFERNRISYVRQISYSVLYSGKLKL